jgi:hypothetical protein
MKTLLKVCRRFILIPLLILGFPSASSLVNHPLQHFDDSAGYVPSPYWTTNGAIDFEAEPIMEDQNQTGFPGFSALRYSGMPQENLPLSNLSHNAIDAVSAGEFLWHTFYGTVSFELGFGVALDPNDGVYISGYSQSSWNGPLGQAPLHDHSGDNDITVLKLNSAGDYQWHTFYGSKDDDISYQIALDPNDGVYLSGHSQSSWNGPAGQAPLHDHSGGDDITLLKLNPAGVYQWHTFYGSIDFDQSYYIGADASGNIYISGNSRSSWTGPAGQTPLHAYSGDDDIVVLKLTAAGGYQWHTFYGSVRADLGGGIAIDANSDLTISGVSYSSWNGPMGQAPLYTHSGEEDITVLKLDAAGVYQWHTFFGSIGYGFSKGIAVDGNGDVYITGFCDASWNGPAGQLPLGAHSGAYYDIAVLKLTGAGVYQWHTFYGSRSYDLGYGVAVDDSDGVYISGYSLNSWNGPLFQTPLQPHNGGEDISVLKLNASGAYQWHSFYGSPYDDRSYWIAVDPNGGLYTTGVSFLSWDGPSGQPPLHAHSGYGDMAVVKLRYSGEPPWKMTYLPAIGVSR